MTRRQTALVAVVVVLGAFAWLLYGNLDKNIVFFLTPQELLAKGVEGYEVPVRLGGQIKPGSVSWEATKLDLRFTIVDGTGAEIAIRSKGAPPQMFRDGMGVVVEGRYERGGIFQATNLLIKHSNEYRAPKAGERPQDMYKSLMKGTGT